MFRLLRAGRVAGAGGVLAAAASCTASSSPALANAAAAAPASRDGYQAPKLGQGDHGGGGGGGFDAWRSSLRSTLPSDGERDVDADIGKFVGQRRDQQFIWQTLRSERGIRRVALWKWALSDDEAVGATTGKARVSALIEVGDALNGHVGVVHGGFTAALLDDVLGQTTIQEAAARGITGAPLTAGLSVKYKRPIFGESVYLVNARVDTITPRNRPGPPSWDVSLSATVRDASGALLVEAESHYVLKQFA